MDLQPDNAAAPYRTPITKREKIFGWLATGSLIAMYSALPNTDAAAPFALASLTFLSLALWAAERRIRSAKKARKT
jgi:hypothetical protein